jgi:hypothetical protein
MPSSDPSAPPPPRFAFDVHTDRLLWDEFDYLADRAQSLLANRSLREVDFAVLAVDYMLHEFENRTREESGFEDHWEELAKSPAAVLRRCMDEYDISGLDDLPGATWPDFFAALACQHLGALYIDQVNGQLPVPSAGEAAYFRDALDPGHIDHFFSAASNVRKATEAICWGEFLHGIDAETDALATRKEKLRISLKNKRVAIEKHKPTAAIKNAFAAYVREDEKRRDNIAGSARDFCDTDEFKKLNKKNDSGETHLKEHNAPVTLANHARRLGLSNKPRKASAKKPLK